MNWWPIIISGGTLLLINVSIIIGYIRNHSKHIENAIEDLKESNAKEHVDIKEDINKIFSKSNNNATNIAKIQGRLNNRK